MWCDKETCGKEAQGKKGTTAGNEKVTHYKAKVWTPVLVGEVNIAAHVPRCIAQP